MKPDSAKKVILLMIGSLSLIIGVIGIILPVMPTTPFLLLSAFCYMRSSEKLYGFLINHPLFGKYIDSYMTYRAVPKTAKISALIFLWLSMSISIFFISILHVRIILGIVGIAVSIHLILLKTMDQVEINLGESDGDHCPKDSLDDKRAEETAE
ncbi:YbaN family protein [Dehalobacter sp. DCM]|uniref:YbaN family protein n=1 Tax=Dehalobacter sp. DCM TaxID=2907827 RepID=UPI00308138BE|nr:YbaN family protein [Dehalobacter sp. DCM]